MQEIQEPRLLSEITEEFKDVVYDILEEECTTSNLACRLLVVDEEWGFHPSDEKEIRRRLEVEGPEMRGSDVYRASIGWVVECREGVAEELLLPPSWTLEKVITYLLANYTRAGLGVLLVDRDYVPFRENE
jgi:hypothetical protein